MRKIMKYCMLLLALMAVASCKEKKQSDIIIAHKPIIMRKQHQTLKTGDETKQQTVSWLGASYSVTVTTKADPSLPEATDGVNKYYDNRITVTINRSDGTQFYKRTFSKADFKPYVDESYYKDGALLAIVFDKAEGNSLKFATSVGSPDKSSDEFMPLELVISNLGATTIQKAMAEMEE